MDINDEKKYSIAKAGIWYTVGNLTIKGIPFFTLPIFISILSTSDFGLYNTYISYESILSIFIGLGLSGTVKIAKYDFREEFEKYISFLYTIIFLFTVIFSPMVFVLFTLVDDDFMIPMVIGILIINSLSTAVFTINNIRCVILGKYKINLIYTLINTILNVGVSLFFCLIIFDQFKYIGRITGTAFSFVAVMIAIVFFQIKRYKLNLCRKYFGYAFRMGIPLIPHLISVTLLSSCDKIMIQNMVGSDEVGIYSLAVNLVAVLSVLVTSLENAWAPWFYSALNKLKYQSIREKNDKMLIFFAYILCGFILIGPELIILFSSAEYTNSIYALVPLTVSVFFNFVYLIPINLEYFKKKTYYISLATIFCAIINIGLNYYFIDQMGYIYAAHATCISKGGLLIFHYVVSKHLEKNDLFSVNIVLLLLGIIIGVSLITVQYLNQIQMRIFTVVIISIFMCIFWRVNKKKV